jgi:hypothetical protein
MKKRRKKMEGPTLERSMSAVVDRLTRAGWTSRACVDPENLSIEWTVKGQKHAKAFADLIDELGGPPPPDELALLLWLIDYYYRRPGSRYNPDPPRA